MGMFDYVELGQHALKCPFCDTPIRLWQTKDSPDQLLCMFRIKEDGIVEKSDHDGDDDNPHTHFWTVPADFCGVWEIHTDCPNECPQSKNRKRALLYAQVVIVDGKLHRVKFQGDQG